MLKFVSNWRCSEVSLLEDAPPPHKGAKHQRQMVVRLCRIWEASGDLHAGASKHQLQSRFPIRGMQDASSASPLVHFGIHAIRPKEPTANNIRLKGACTWSSEKSAACDSTAMSAPLSRVCTRLQSLQFSLHEVSLTACAVSTRLVDEIEQLPPKFFIERSSWPWRLRGLNTGHIHDAKVLSGRRDRRGERETEREEIGADEQYSSIKGKSNL